MTIRRAWECTLSYGSLIIEKPGIQLALVERNRPPCYLLGKVYEANLAEHPIPRCRLLLGRVKENMGLSFSILIVAICGTIGLECGIVDGQI